MSVLRQISSVVPQRVVIIGGVAGGATAAARARRVSERSDIIMLEKGRDVSIASCGLPYHISGEIKDRSKLVMTTSDSLRSKLNVDVRVGHEVTSINRSKHSVDVHDVLSGTDFTIPYDKLVIATGASPLLPSIPGINEAIEKRRLLTLRDLNDMDLIIKRVQEKKSHGRAVVVGAGFIGLEVAEALSQTGLSVTVVEFQSHVLPLLDEEIVEPITKEMTHQGVRVLPSHKVVGFHCCEQDQEESVLVELDSGEKLKADFVIQSIGVSPESKLAENAGLELGLRKTICVNPFMQTSDPNIYAVGDVVSTPFVKPPRQVWLPLGGPANRMARIAADHMFLGDALTDPYRGSFGTSIVRVFGAVAGKTGLTERDCISLGLEYGVAAITGPSHATYYPGSNDISLKVVYDKNTEKILGGQAVGGAEGVDKRLDVLSTAMAGNLSIKDLSHLDLAYAPPFGSARDVINTVGFAGQNAMMGILEPIFSLEDCVQMGPGSPLVLDVRDSDVAEAFPLSDCLDGFDKCNAVNIPLEELRPRINEIRKMAGDRPVIAVCSRGKFSYFATRILAGNDIPSRSLAGGEKLMKGKKVHLLKEPVSRHPSQL